MNMLECIDRIIFIPPSFEIKEKTHLTMLKESGYFEFWNDITVSDIEKEVRKYPEVIQNWYNFSDQWRAPEGWHFINNVPGKYCIYYYPYNIDSNFEIYTDEFIACATYIKKMVETMRVAFSK